MYAGYPPPRRAAYQIIYGAAHPGRGRWRREATCLLLDLNHDELSIVHRDARALCDPLRPLLAVHLTSTAKGLREAMEEQLAELKWQRELGSGWGGRNGAEQKVHYM